MKHTILISLVLYLFISCGDSDKKYTSTLNPTTDPGVIINGVKWATRNLDVGGKFAEHPEDFGALYQWGRKADGHEKSSSAVTDVLASSDNPGHGNFIVSSKAANYDWRSPQNDALWNAGTEDAPVKSANDPSPAGWRVPTDAEFAKLLDKSKVMSWWDDDKKGYVFTDIESNLSVFFLAEGSRSDADAYFFSRIDGIYWSSTPDGTDACYLWFNDDRIYRYRSDRYKGHSLRCVAE